MAWFHFPEQVNERAARLVAGAVALSLAAAWALRAPWVVPLLALGFLLRVGWGPRVSPLARAAVALASRLGPPRPVPGGPKRFAQALGAGCTLLASALLALGQARAGWALAGLVGLLASLEASLAFCLGCWLYARLQGLGLLPPEACPRCAPGDQPGPGASGSGSPAR